jgi:protein arginine kinase
MLRWFEQTGTDNDVVLSSRVRLARNIDRYRFSHKMNEAESMELLQDVHKKLAKEKQLKPYHYFELMDMEAVQKTALVERHVISSFLQNQSVGAAFVSPDEKVSIMINEEDHIRIQSFAAGRNLGLAYKAADGLDDMIGAKYTYAFDERFGYLTSCPSNVGTGLKASYTLHLPALCNSRKIQGIANELGRFGLAMKPVFEMKGNAEGHLYQVSNQRTLGQTEEEILENLNNIVNGIVEQERKGRTYFVSKERLRIEDEVYKSYGILKYSRKMSLSDAMLLLSRLRMGIACGLIRLAEEQPFLTYQMMIGIQPANLKILSGGELSEGELDELRASFIRENIPAIN